MRHPSQDNKRKRKRSKRPSRGSRKNCFECYRVQGKKEPKIFPMHGLFDLLRPTETPILWILGQIANQ